MESKVEITGSSPVWGSYSDAPLAKWIPRHPPKFLLIFFYSFAMILC